MPISSDFEISGPSPQRPEDSRIRAGNEAGETISHNHCGGLELSSPRSRQELISRIKREQRSPWLHSTPEQTDSQYDEWQEGMSTASDAHYALQQQHSTHLVEAAGNRIVRPRSALHAGDFGAHHDTKRGTLDPFDVGTQTRLEPLSTSPPAPWYSTNPASGTSSDVGGRYNHSESQSRRLVPYPRDRALSYSSLSNSFASRPPTSPLALQFSSVDFGTNDGLSRERTPSPGKSSRRRTYSPSSLRGYRSHPLVQSLDNARVPPSLRKHDTYPRQAHQPRRSISSLHSGSGPQSPLTRPRRSSLFSDISPLQGAPMVGGYEESILRGRMSTLPSRPLDFVAQIGVLGTGACKPSLRCPTHITVPFPAVFYNYGPSLNVKSSAEAGPSPYVGMVDLENRPVRKHDPGGGSGAVDDFRDTGMPLNLAVDPPHLPPSLDGRPSKRARHGIPRHAPKGAYRIPQEGQLQIIIKNPHKTAVKLFLVPYALKDMQPGQKTFIRQRSYSAGPIIDMPLTARKNLGTDRPEAALSTSDDPKDRPVLRYLIHLHICCPSRGRFYLYRSVRIVFANRVPDGKEKLRNEVQLPDPLYSPYKADVEAATSNVHERLPPEKEAPLSERSTSRPGMFSLPLHAHASAPATTSIETLFTFRRKPLVAAIPEGSSNASSSSGRSPRAPSDELGFDLSPRSSSGRGPELDESSSDLTGVAASPRPDSARSFSPLRRGFGSGLLALQLREDNSRTDVDQ